MRSRRPTYLGVTFALLACAPCAAQRRVTLAEAEAAALDAGSRVRLAAADAAVADAAVLSARAYPNPVLSGTYSKSPPQYHLIGEQQLELPWLRRARVAAALAGATGARYRLAIERAAVRFAVDSAYVQAVAAAELARLSARTAAEGSELVRVAATRNAAGDASELDVELARVTEGGFANAALADSLEALAALLELQVLMGMQGRQPAIAPADSLASLPLVAAHLAGDAAAAAPLLATAAAEAELRTQQATLRQERAARLPAPSLMGGVEWHDPTGSEQGYLPTFGVSVPLPLWDRNRGAIAAAQAGVQRAQVALEAAQREGAAALAAAEREQAAARVRMERDRALLQHARRVVEMTTRGYREGAFPITQVIEAQRAARDVLRQYLLDLAAMHTASASTLLARTVGALP